MGASRGTHNEFNLQSMITKNPSTAAGTYVQGFGGMQGNLQAPIGYGLKSGGGAGLKYPMESFDLDIMMPPDIASIDSDINKLSAMTPSPFPSAGGWGNQMDNHNNGYNLGGGIGFHNEFSNGKVGNHYSNQNNYGKFNQYEGDS
jgi:hypothetical protein